MSHIEGTRKELLDLLALFKAINCSTSDHSTHLLIQNTCKGPVISTSHSLELTRRYTTNNPLVQLLLTAVQNHRNHLKDGGCFLGMLVCEMVTKFYQSGHHPHMHTQVLSWCSTQASVIMEQLAVNKLEVNVDSIASVLYSITNSKLTSYLPQSDINKLVKHLANVFILCGGVTHQHTLGYLKGIDTELTMTLNSGIVLDNHHTPITPPAGRYVTVLISCSMSGDTEEVIDGVYLGTSSQHISEAIMEKLEAMVVKCAGRGVSLFICQRVIHPAIKLKLESLKIRYLERLGLAIHRIAYMTGLAPCQSVTDRMWPEAREISIEHCKHNDEVHLLLSCTNASSKPVFTFQISSWSELITKDIEAACMQALEVLQVLLTDMRLLPGRGHWQRLVSKQIKKLASCITSDDVKKLDCTISSFRSVAELFTTALHAESLIGSSEDVGQKVEDSIDIQDCFVAFHTALTSAVSIAKAIILTGRVIKES